MEDNTLYKALAQLKSEKEIKTFVLDLCTPNEIRSMQERLRVALLIDKGDSYRQINDSTGVSTATITRVARYLLDGKGYKNVIQKLKDK